MLRHLIWACLVGVAWSYSQGAPNTACNSLKPGHNFEPQASAAPFKITTNVISVEPGSKITITLAPTDGVPFKGFLIQGRDSDQQVTGTFFPQDHNSLTCGKGFSNAVTHSGAAKKMDVVLEWEPSSDYEGDVTFMCTILRSYDTFWMGITSEKVTVKRSISEPTPDSKPIVFPAFPTSAPTTPPPPTTAPTTTTPPELISDDPSKNTVSDQSNSSPLLPVIIDSVGDSVISIIDAPAIVSFVVDRTITTVNNNVVATTSDVVISSTSVSKPSPTTGIPLVTTTSFVGSTQDKTTDSSTKGFAVFKNPGSTSVTTPPKSTTTATPTTTTEDPSDNLVESPSPDFLSASLNSIYLGCEVNKGCFGLPKGCLEKENCKSLVTYTRDSSGGYLFELMGQASTGYVAAGLSDDEKMGKDSVMVCRNFNNEVDVVMSWNIPDRKSNVILVDNQLGLSNIQVGQIDDKIICRFIREKKTEINNAVFDLDDDQLHLMIAQGPLKTDGNLQYHAAKEASGRPLNFSKFDSIESASKLFKLLHACFMIGAWIGTASCGILFARYYKKTWLNSQCCGIDQWFHWHRIFMILTWSLTMAGVALIVYYLKGWSQVPINENPHAVIGVISAGLCFIQPFMAMCRPGPNAKSRPLFNWFHWGVGNLAQILGIAAIFFGLDLYGGIPSWSWWIVIAFVAFHCLVHLLLSIGQCISDSRNKKRGDVYPLKNMNSSRDPLQPGEPLRQNAPGGVFRKMMLALYLIINWAFTAALILVVVLGEEQLRDWNLLFWENL